jgi:RimJ/RimL family protein N-acetyltransferase
MRLETERLVLRQPATADLDDLTALYGDEDVMRFIAEGGPWPPARTAAALDGMMRRWAEDGFGMFVGERRDDGALIGDVGLLPWDPRTWRPGSRVEIGPHAEVEIGWTLVRDAWGRGYATEAALAARDWALGELGLTRLISLIRPENAASIRVAEKIGERYERDVVTNGDPARLYSLERGRNQSA